MSRSHLLACHGCQTLDFGRYDNFPRIVAPTGQRVRMDAYTTYFTSDVPTRVSELRPGSGLAVARSFEHDGTLLADVIVIGSAR